ncbi:DUF6493 family protein [Kitasatospora sp. NPDC051914]|uniref:DUF6493 family protein n=1 Tax=Kitasatospora sp. NPDC051914 TaxID=3154945 RepID=UPI0034207297
MNDGTATVIGWDEVRALIAGRVPGPVIERLSGVPAERLAHLRTPLRKLRSELLREAVSADANRSFPAYGQLAALQAAGLSAARTPAEALDWLTHRRLRDVTWTLPDGGSTNADHRALLAVLLEPHRSTAWQCELATRLAEWLPPRGDGPRWLVAHGLAVWSGAAVPATDGYVTGWVRQGGLMRYQHREIAEWFADQGLREPVPHHDTLLSWLRAQPRLAEFVRRLFEVPDVGAEFTDPYAARSGPDNEWPEALAALAAEGVLDRAELLDHCLGKLLRGDRPGNLRGFLHLHDALAPDPDEILARSRDYLRLAADGAPTAAKTAQAALRTLGDRLPADTFAELTEAVLGRPEKTLANTQLTWAGSLLRHHPAQADALLPAVAAGFAHPAAGVQDKALQLAARHLAQAGPDTVRTLRTAARGLGPVPAADARRLLGTDDATADAAADAGAGPAATPGPLPPAAPVLARPMPPAVSGPYELAERLAALLADHSPEPAEFEVVLAAVVAEHHRDAPAVAEALAPLAARRGRSHWFHSVELRNVRVVLGCLFDVLAGEDHGHDPEGYTAELCALPAHLRTASVLPALRVLEVASGLAGHRADRGGSGGPVPVLLATPTGADGTLDPAVFADRLDACRAAGAVPWPVDLAQALLRLPPEAVAAATDLARGLGAEPPTAPLQLPEGFHVQRPDMPERTGPYGWKPPMAPRIAPCGRPGPDPAAVAPVDRPAALLSAVPDPGEAVLFVVGGHWAAGSAWLAQLPVQTPWHPESAAAHAVPALAVQALDGDGQRGANPVLPLLAEAPGTPGPVCHLALAYGLTAARADHRTAALDALLTMAARGTLQGRDLGGRLAGLWELTVAKPNRFLPVLADAARGGAGPAVWPVLAALIAEAAAAPARRGLADLLTTAAECAAASGIRADLPVLDALTAPAAPRRVRTEAARLREVLRRSPGS